VQVFYQYGSTRTEPILAVVGELQFEVAKYRLEEEYNAKTVFDRLALSLARRVRGDSADISSAQIPSNARLVEDWDGHPVALFESEWSLRLAQEWNPKLEFVAFSSDTKEVVSQ
jgi:peptide chain release factor 3